MVVQTRRSSVITSTSSNDSHSSNGINGNTMFDAQHHVHPLNNEKQMKALETQTIRSSTTTTTTTSSSGIALYEALDLLVSVLGIYICYLIYAVLQERLTSSHAHDSNQVDEHMYLMLIQCIINATFVYPIVQYIESTTPPYVPVDHDDTIEHPYLTRLPIAVKQLKYASIGFTYIMGMLTSYWSFSYINYPTSVLVKSCKMVPVMFIGVVLFRKRYSIREYICVLSLTAGIYGFMYYGSSSSKAASVASNSIYGVLLSGLSLLCDGFTGSQQDNFVQIYKPSSYRLMYETNKWAVIELFLVSACTGELYAGIQSTIGTPGLLYDLVLFGIVSAIGQLFIFHMITAFGALALAITTSTRKLATILCSTIMFGHHISEKQWLCVIVVFASLLIDIYGKAYSRKQIDSTTVIKEKKIKKVV